MTDLNFTCKRIPSKAKYFEKKYGGKWRYDNYGGWRCDDNVRHISRVSSCDCDYNCNHLPEYRLYGDGINGIIYFD